MVERLTTAGILIKDNSVFVAKRNQGHGNDNIWELPGGKNRYGENVEQTLKREWKEELNLDITVGKLVTTCDFENNDIYYRLRAYLVYCADFSTLKLNEHSEYKFVDKREQRALEMMNSDKRIFEAVWIKFDDLI